MNMYLQKCSLPIVIGAAMFASVDSAHAQVSRDQEVDARRQALFQQSQLIADDGEIVDQNEILMPVPNSVPPEAIATQSSLQSRDPQKHTVYRTVGWRNRYYGRPNSGYYYGPPRGGNYARYPGYYSPYYGNSYYGGYGYRGNYYGTPRFGYHDYPYGGAVRVGPLRAYWR